MASEWRNVGRINYLYLHAARVQAHYAVQWLARAARATIAAQADDRHTSLGWDDGFGGFVSHPLPGGVRIGLRIADLTLAVLGGVGLHELPLDGRADADVQAWLGARLAATGLKPNKLDAPAPYTIPDHALARGARYSLDELGEAFHALAQWCANAHAALVAMQQRLAAKKLKAPPVRCWAHHFDFDCLVALGRGRTMGVGFCPGDEFCDEPYFYISMRPEPWIPDLPLLPAMGHWHTYKFLAAMAPAHKILAAHEQGAYVRTFLDVATKAALDALRR
jgi:hypothetical protein